MRDMSASSSTHRFVYACLYGVKSSPCLSQPCLVICPMHEAHFKRSILCIDFVCVRLKCRPLLLKFARSGCFELFLCSFPIL